MSRFLGTVVAALIACSALGQSFLGKWEGKVVVVGKPTKNVQSLANVRKYQDAAKATKLSLILNKQKTFSASIMNANGVKMTMGGTWSYDGVSLMLKATTANGVIQRDPGIITINISKDGKTLVASIDDAEKTTKWVYSRQAGKKNGK